MALKQSLLDADDTGHSRLSQAAAVLKLLQSHNPALSTFTQALGRPGPGLPIENSRTSAIAGPLSPAPYSTNVAVPDQQALWQSPAPLPSSIGRMPQPLAGYHTNGTQVYKRP